MIDVSGNGIISAQEWNQVSADPAMREQLQCLGVEVPHMEQRLIQMRHTIFGLDEEEVVGKKTDKSFVAELGYAPDKKFNAAVSEAGLNFDQFTSKVHDLRWDTPMSILDLEQLKRAVNVENANANAKLNLIETRLEEVVRRLKARVGVTEVDKPPVDGTATALREGERLAAASRPSEEAPLFGVVPTDSPRGEPSRGEPSGGGGLATTRDGEDGSNQTGELRMSDVPTELLFQTLRTRARMHQVNAP
jgi:hypothetical protein